MKTILLPGLLKPTIFLAVLLLSLAAFSQSGPELVFTNPVLKSGTAKKEGAVYRFNNVTSGVDAELKLKKFSRQDIVVADVDLATLGWDKAFQPQFGLPGLVPPYQNWYIDFEMTFYKAGTTVKQKMDTIDLTALDMDGDGRSISEYCTFESPSSIAYSTLTYLTSQVNGILGQVFPCDADGISSQLVHCTNCNGTGITNSGSGNNNECQNCDGSGLIHEDCDHPYQGTNGNTVNGPVNNFANIDTSATQVMATYQYTNKDRIKFRYGAQSGLNSSNGSGIRLNSIWFREFSLVPEPVTLPVTLTSFTAMLNDDKTDLNWTTASEKNLNHFSIEKSLDGRSFTEAGVVVAYGNSSQTTNYSYTDKEINTSKPGVIYYRLRSVDIDGKSELSAVRMITIGRERKQLVTVEVYPNPVKNELCIIIPAEWQGKKVIYELVSNNGGIARKAVAGSANQTETINIGGLVPGFYLIRVTCNGEIAQQKIIKQ